MLNKSPDLETDCIRIISSLVTCFFLFCYISSSPSFLMSNVDGSSTHARFACGLASGLGQSTLFNPYDRAMYRSITEKKSFLDKSNWRGNPFAGVSPSFIQRSVSAGLYFPLEDFFRRTISSNYAVDGVLVGMVGGVFTTPFNSVKYAMWSSASTSISFTARNLYERGGVSRLMRGVLPTLYRDMSFGVVYSVLRHKGDNGFVNNVLAAFIATAVSSPFNYARMKIYASQTPIPTSLILSDLRREIQTHHPSAYFKQAKFTFQTLNVGWGALRVGLGMGVGSQIYNMCCNNRLL